MTKWQLVLPEKQKMFLKVINGLFFCQALLAPTGAQGVTLSLCLSVLPSVCLSVCLRYNCYIYLVCNNCHSVVVEVGTAPGRIAWKIRSRSLQGYWCNDQDNLAATKIDVRCVDSVVNFHIRTKRHIDL